MREQFMLAAFKGTLSDPAVLSMLTNQVLYYHNQVKTFNAYFPIHIVLTERARLDLIRNYNVDPQRVVVIHHSMPVEKFNRDEQAGERVAPGT